MNKLKPEPKQLDRTIRFEVWTPPFAGKDGGIQSHSRDLIHALRKISSSAEPRVVVYSVSGNPLVKVWNQVTFLFRTLSSLLNPPNLICITHIDLAPVATLLNHFRRIPYVVSCHGIEVWRDLPTYKVTALTAADQLLCVSPYTRSRLITDFGVNETRTTLFPNTTNFPDSLADRVSTREKLTKHYSIPAGDHVIYTLGRMRPADREKGYGRLWQAVALMNTSGISTTLIAAGSGSDISWLEQQAQSAQLSDKLKCPGRISSEAVITHYQGCDLFALPSTKEGFGIVFLEAIAQGTPVLAGNQDGSTEPTLDGRCGLLCDPTSPTEIAKIMTEFLSDPDHPLRDRFRLKSTAEKHFGAAAYQARLAELLKRVI